jgi:hypothetical protein
MYSLAMQKVSRNDPCSCGSGKKYKKCCLNKDAAEATQLTSTMPELFRPAALCLVGDSHVPAIACDDENDTFLYVLARASRQMDALEAAEEAAADLDSIPGSTRDFVGPNSVRYLQKIGYRIMSGVTLDHIDLLEDLLGDEGGEDDAIDDLNPEDLIIEALWDEAERQISEEDPPEVRKTLVRLRRAGFSRDKVLELIVHVMMHETKQAGEEKGKINIARYVAALAKLPQLDCEDEH